MLWTKVLGVASFAIPFLFGLMFTSMIQGVPMDAKGNVTATFTTYVNFFVSRWWCCCNALSLASWLKLFSFENRGSFA